MHYWRWWKWGRTYAEAPDPPSTLDRALQSIDRDGVGGCWDWLGSQDENGYGNIKVFGTTKSVHRVVYESLVGPIPDGLVLDHLCRRRICCFPDHLEPVTAAENARRGAEANRRTNCPQGHPYDDENTYTNKLGRKVCRICARAARSRWETKQATG